MIREDPGVHHVYAREVRAVSEYNHNECHSFIFTHPGFDTADYRKVCTNIQIPVQFLSKPRVFQFHKEAMKVEESGGKLACCRKRPLDSVFDSP